MPFVKQEDTPLMESATSTALITLSLITPTTHVSLVILHAKLVFNTPANVYHVQQEASLNSLAINPAHMELTTIMEFVNIVPSNVPLVLETPTLVLPAQMVNSCLAENAVLLAQLP